MSDPTLVPPSKLSTPSAEVPSAPELGYQEPSEPLTAKKTARKKAAPKKAATAPQMDEVVIAVTPEPERAAPLKAATAPQMGEVVIASTPEPERAAPLPPLSLEEALPLF